MKLTRRTSVLICILALILCVSCAPAYAQAEDGAGAYPADVIEVPQGTEIAIDDDAGTVTITDCPREISAGDSFIVYLQDLPIGYTANEVSVSDNVTVIRAEKADKSIYGSLREEGVVYLTPDMYEFIPAENVLFSESTTYDSAGESASLSYEDGVLTMTFEAGGTSASVSLSGLQLRHALNDGDVSVTLTGYWGLSTALSVSESIEVPLGEIRIMGVGKIALGLNLEADMSIEGGASGWFETSVSVTQNGVGTFDKNFSTSECSISGKGSLSAAIRITAGVDVLMAAADLYTEIGLTTEFHTQVTYHADEDRTTYCEDYKTYVFSRVGAEVLYYSFTENKMKLAASLDFDVINENNTPYIFIRHFENGEPTNICSEELSYPDREIDGSVPGFSGSVLTDGRKRIIETDVELPGDMIVSGDLFLAGGWLNLNGHSLTIEGDLIQSGGKLTVNGNGRLIVRGDYRLQSLRNGEYGDSAGEIEQSESGMIEVGGDFVLQTNAEINRFYGGVMMLKGNLIQKNPAVGKCSIDDLWTQFVMSADKSHTISMEDPDNNRLRFLTLLQDVTVNGSIKIGELDMNGHNLTINGDLEAYGTFRLQDRDPGDFGGGELLGEDGTLTVNGNLIHTGAIYLDGGTMTVTGNYYHPWGFTVVGSGVLNVGGNYYQDGSGIVYTPGCEEYETGQGNLHMDDSAGEVHIGGSFLSATPGNYSNSLDSGTMYIGGDLRVLHDAFCSGSEHRLVFTNPEAVLIEMPDVLYSGFGQLDIAARTVTIKGAVRWDGLLRDLDNVISDGMTLGYRDITHLSGHKVTINGDLTIGESISLDGGTLTVTGNVYHQNGYLTIDSGVLNVGGNYYQVGAGSVYTPGSEQYESCYGGLYMENNAGEVHVGGSFISASDGNAFYQGTLYIGGDFRAVSDRFACSDTHKVVMNGNGPQSVRFSDSNGRFGVLELMQPPRMYSFTPNPCWQRLIISFGTPDFVLPALVTEIEESAFENTAAAAVYIPDGCTEIGPNAFRDSGLQKIRIPAGCAIDPSAFAGCGDIVIFSAAESPAQEYCAAHSGCIFVEE